MIYSCKDCLHYEACKGTYYTAKGGEDILYEFESEMYAHSGCEHFKPKADYAPVVRCKDCTEWDTKEKECSHWYGFRENDFCSYGKREGAE